MKAKDIIVGQPYAVKRGYPPRAVRAVVLEVPVVRMEKRAMWERGSKSVVLRPVRRDERADGVRVKFGTEAVDVVLADVLRPWSEADESDAMARIDCAERVTAMRATLDRLGVPYERSWRGEALTVGQVTVALPFESLEAWLSRVDPVKVAEVAIDEFVRRASAEKPWTGLADAHPVDIAAWKHGAVAEARRSAGAYEIAACGPRQPGDPF